MRDDIHGHRRPAQPEEHGTSPMLARLLALVAVVHAVLVPAGALPGGWGAVPAALDATVAVLVLGGLVAVRTLKPELPAVALQGAAAAAVVLLGVASGVRAAAAGEVWAGADAVLAVLVAAALPTWGLFLVAAVGAQAAVTTGQVVGGVNGPDGVGAAGWVLVGAVAVATLLVSAVVRQSHAGVVEALETARRTAGQQAVTDPLTGVTNRRGLELMALPMIEHARRQGEAAHCLFIDLDGFRAVNDALGRDSGDEVLTSVCEAVLASVRATDVVARWAGDQFVVIGPGTGTSPLEMERRVRHHLADSPPVPQEIWDGRVSIGSATLVPWDDGNIDSLLRRAEEDMQLRRSLRRQSRSRSMGMPPAAAPDRTPRTERRGAPKPQPPHA